MPRQSFKLLSTTLEVIDCILNWKRDFFHVDVNWDSQSLRHDTRDALRVTNYTAILHLSLNIHVIVSSEINERERNL